MEEKDELIKAQNEVIGILFEVIKKLQENIDLQEEGVQLIINSKEDDLDKSKSKLDEITKQRNMNAEMISYPNTKLMCSVNVDGAAAAVLVSEKKAKELGMQRAVRIKASVMTSDPYQERDLVMPDVNSCTRKAAAEAYEMAGLDSSDVDLVELHDCFATAEMLHY